MYGSPKVCLRLIYWTRFEVLIGTGLSALWTIADLLPPQLQPIHLIHPLLHYNPGDLIDQLQYRCAGRLAESAVRIGLKTSTGESQPQHR